MNSTDNSQSFSEKYGETFCIKPFTEICNTPTGGVKLCCNSDSVVNSRDVNGRTLADIFFNDQKISDIRKKILAGEKIPACSRCYSDEKIIGKSMRIERSSSLEKNFPDSFEKIVNHGHVELLTMDVKFGNKCNLGCVMCEPSASSVIALERRKNKIPSSVQSVWELPEKVNYDFLDAEFDALKEYSHTLNSFAAKGGEPTLLPFYNKWIDHLVDTGHSKNIKFFTVTNGTVDLSKKISQIKEFKEFEICWSIDGIGKTLEYIRWPASFKKISSNQKKLINLVKDNDYKNFLFSFNTVAHVLNVDQLVAVARYADSLKIIDNISFLDELHIDAMSTGLISEKTLVSLKTDINEYNVGGGRFKQALNDIYIMIEENYQIIRKDQEKFQKSLNQLQQMTEFWKDVRGLDVNDYCATYADTISQLK
jgi:MoaA/NifB/PqqE/SkfB family radical SAM enzyme